MSDYICPECGEEMNEADDTVIVCDNCGYSMDIDDYGNENDYERYYSEEEDDIPEGCAACGGPYPHCKTSCRLFDD